MSLLCVFKLWALLPEIKSWWWWWWERWNVDVQNWHSIQPSIRPSGV